MARELDSGGTVAAANPASCAVAGGCYVRFDLDAQVRTITA